MNCSRTPSILLCLCLNVAVHAASPIVTTPVGPTRVPGLPTDGLTKHLSPPPTVDDWQPRSRAVTGGIIVITGRDFRPAEFEAVVGARKFRLPVRQASSTSSRIELEVPATALGNVGALIVGHHLTQSRTLETNYKIDELTPAITQLSTGTPAYPFVNKVLTINIKEFPGVRINPNDVSFGGNCQFKKRSSLTYSTVNRAADFSLHLIMQGWFEKSGNCELQVILRPIDANGATLPSVQLAAPFGVAVPVQYSFANTNVLKTRLSPTFTHAGFANLCNGTSPAGPVGIVDIGSDFAMIARGGLLDVSCTFRTKEWILPEGVRLKSIQWRTNTVGNRCADAGTFSSTIPSLPGTNLSLTRGTVVVRPKASQPASDFFVFSDTALVVDGVTFASNLNAPTTMIKPFTLDIDCASTATFLGTLTGTSPPTLDPQSYSIILDSLILEGPPGLTLP